MEKVKVFLSFRLKSIMLLNFPMKLLLNLLPISYIASDSYSQNCFQKVIAFLAAGIHEYLIHK